MVSLLWEKGNTGHRRDAFENSKKDFVEKERVVIDSIMNIPHHMSGRAVSLVRIRGFSTAYYSFKEENNFKRGLKKMNLSNVISAIERSKKIMLRNNENGYKLCEYNGYKYYRENPLLAVWESIEKILKDCELV